MICVPSNPRLPYLWKIACFSNGGADCRWQVWWVVRWVGLLNGSSVQQGIRAPAALHKPFLWQWLASWSQEKSLNQAAVSVSAGILARNETWLVLAREICLAELPRCIVLGLFFPWVVLVISDSASCAFLRERALPVITCGCTGGMGAPVSHCHESCPVLLDLILRGCGQNLCFVKHL